MNKYAHPLSDHEVRDGRYKRMLGGGEKAWDARGAAQLDFLRAMGLQPSSRLLDIGCGPLRAGTHFISFLDPGCYSGFDFNSSFVQLAEQAVDEHSLSAKRPRIALVQDFAVAGQFADNDFGIAFSVLQHCVERDRKLFFRNIAAAFRDGASLFVTHAGWFTPRWLDGAHLNLIRAFEFGSLRWFDDAWPEPERKTVFPILELTVER
jgi:SAM-dependent methyltransferase